MITWDRGPLIQSYIDAVGAQTLCKLTNPFHVRFVIPRVRNERCGVIGSLTAYFELFQFERQGIAQEHSRTAT